MLRELRTPEGSFWVEHYPGFDKDHGHMTDEEILEKWNDWGWDVWPTPEIRELEIPEPRCYCEINAQEEYDRGREDGRREYEE